MLNIENFSSCMYFYSDEVLKSLGDGLKNFRADKGKIGWDILALESAVDSQTDRERDSDDE